MKSRLSPHSRAGAEQNARVASVAQWRRAIALLRGRQRFFFALSIGARIAVGLCDLALAAAMYLLFLVLQGGSPAHESWWMPKTLLSAVMCTSILVVVRALADISSYRFVLRNFQKLYNDFLLRLTQGYSQMRWSRFAGRNRSELSHHVFNTAREAADFYQRCVEMSASVVIVAVMAAALVYQSPMAAIAFGCALAAFYGVHRLFVSRRVREAASNREKLLCILQRNLASILSAGKEIRTYENYAYFHDEIRSQAERAAVSTQRAAFLPYVMRIIADQGTVLLFLGMIGAIELWQGDTHRLLSILAFYFVLSRRLLPLVSQISLIAGQMESSYENVKIVESELNACRRYGRAPCPPRLPAFGLVLELNHVSFSFHEDTPILLDVSLNLHEGEIVLLHGASGVGKSSLLDLIAGVSQPASGSVRVDRTGIAYVPQDIALLDESIRSNLLFGLPGKSDDELMTALALARLDQFVAALPLGLETGAGDNGALFSGGERQRLGLARAILRGGTLMLLDEATSALDKENERKIFDNLRDVGKAILLVTHRVHETMDADRVFRLENGSLIEETSLASPTREFEASASL